MDGLKPTLVIVHWVLNWDHAHKGLFIWIPWRFLYFHEDLFVHHVLLLEFGLIHIDLSKRVDFGINRKRIPLWTGLNYGLDEEEDSLANGCVWNTQMVKDFVLCIFKYCMVLMLWSFVI